MAYTIKDMKEAAIGAFSSVLFFFAIRQGDPLTVKPLIGLIIGAIWLGLLMSSTVKNREGIVHFMGNLAIVIALTQTLAYAFGMVGQDLIFNSFEYFGSAAWISVWLGMPVATLFDMNNFTDIMSRYYARGRRK